MQNQGNRELAKEVDVNYLSSQLPKLVLHDSPFTKPGFESLSSTGTETYSNSLVCTFLPIKMFMFICQTGIAVETYTSLNSLQPFSEFRKFCFLLTQSLVLSQIRAKIRTTKVRRLQSDRVVGGWLNDCKSPSIIVVHRHATLTVARLSLHAPCKHHDIHHHLMIFIKNGVEETVHCQCKSLPRKWRREIDVCLNPTFSLVDCVTLSELLDSPWPSPEKYLIPAS